VVGYRKKEKENKKGNRIAPWLSDYISFPFYLPFLFLLIFHRLLSSFISFFEKEIRIRRKGKRLER